MNIVPAMKITIITLFPESFISPFSVSIVKRAQEKGLLGLNYLSLFDFGIGVRKKVDDTPYGGGPGMVLRVDVMAEAITEAKQQNQGAKVILLTPKGERLTQGIVQSLARDENGLILICGHYEGFDERIRKLVDREISLGDFVLSGGEAAAVALVDGIARLLPGSLGKEASTKVETHCQEGYLEYPQYTRPEDWHGEKVPEVLLSGDHQKICNWRQAHEKIIQEKQ